MMSITLDGKNDEVRRQQIRLYALGFATSPAAITMGRGGGPLQIAAEFEKWVLYGEPDRTPPVRVNEPPPPAPPAPGQGGGDVVKVDENRPHIPPADR